MAIEHKLISNAELHEPKGASAASSNQVYMGTGSGSGTWRYNNPIGVATYLDIATGTTITTPTAYTILNMVSSAGKLIEHTHNSLSRLTYTGTEATHGVCHVSITFKHSVGSGADCYFQPYLNGSAITAVEHVVSADSANFHHISFSFDTALTTNDYVEIYAKVATGNIVIHGMHMEVVGVQA